MKILVTGSSGLIGHHVLKELGTKHGTIGVDNHDLYASLDKAEHTRLVAERQAYAAADYEYKMDLRNGPPDHVDFDAVIHTASFPRQAEVTLSPIAAMQTMTIGLHNTLLAAKNARRFVFLSSSMVYGDFHNFVTEDHPTNPNTLYGQLKLAGEQTVKTFCERHNLPYTIIRPSAVYGERDVNNRIVGKFLSQAHRNEELVVKGPDEVLDFTHVSDLAKGIVQATFNPDAQWQTYNMTRSENCRTILDAASVAIDTVGEGTMRWEPRDTSFPKRGNLSIDKAREHFGYDPKINIEEGFARYYDWIYSFFKR